MSENVAESFDNGQTDVNAASVEEISITLIILEVLCMVAAPYSASCYRTQTVYVVLVALLLLSQWCSVFVMSVTVYLYIGKDYKEVSRRWT